MKDIDRSEITPEWVYMNRRRFMRSAGLALTGAALAACGRAVPTPTSTPAPEPTSQAAEPEPSPFASSDTDELGGSLTTYDSVTGFNNYYEFNFGQTGIASYTKDFRMTPWKVEVGGLVKKPRAFTMEDLAGIEQEERIYRMRCVEGWAMVIPWIGFPLSKILDQVEPTDAAKYVRFETLYDPSQMPNQTAGGFEWPYVEGLRLDEAQHDLTILATGLYGKPLLAQNGGPVRLVVPWKYGFKSIKSIVKIDLVEEMPVSLWMAYNPREYGFYANVNPDVDHPRWSQATERRIGEAGRQETLLFNGYDQVAEMYAGMNLREFL